MWAKSARRCREGRQVESEQDEAAIALTRVRKVLAAMEEARKTVPVPATAT